LKVAVPAFGNRVAPRLECAGLLLVADIRDGQMAERKSYPLWQPSLHALLGLLLSLGVEVVICGGISGFMARHLQAAGIKVFANIMGDVNSALGMFAKGDLRQGWRQIAGPRRSRRRASRGWSGPPFGGIR